MNNNSMNDYANILFESWVFHHPILLFFAIVLVGIAFSIIRALSTWQQRLRDRVAYVQNRDYHFVNPNVPSFVGLSVREQLKMLKLSDSKSNLSEGIVNAGIHEFQDHYPTDEMAFYLRHRGNKLTIFKHSYSLSPTSAANGSTSMLQYRVAKYQNEKNMPTFRLEKRGLSTKVAVLVTRILESKNINFTAPEISLSSYPEFSKQYFLTTENEEETKNFFTAHKIGKLEKLGLSGTIATNANHLVYLESGNFTDDASYDDFISTAKAALDCLMEESA